MSVGYGVLVIHNARLCRAFRLNSLYLVYSIFMGQTTEITRTIYRHDLRSFGGVMSASTYLRYWKQYHVSSPLE